MVSSPTSTVIYDVVLSISFKVSITAEAAGRVDDVVVGIVVGMAIKNRC